MRWPFTRKRAAAHKRAITCSEAGRKGALTRKNIIRRQQIERAIIMCRQANKPLPLEIVNAWEELS